MSDPDSSLPVVPNRKITGISAVLLPFLESGEIDWDSFRSHLRRTMNSGLIPAVNMDTGYGNLIDNSIRKPVLEVTRDITSGSGFVAGAFVHDEDGSVFNLDPYARAMELIESHGGIPVIFQSFGLTQQADEQIVQSYENLGEKCDRFIGFELDQVFAPFGSIYSLSVYQQMVGIKKCMGAKHSSLSRQLEWQRLKIRNHTRPEFKVFTGNDLAIDMVIYGSDYLLGLSTFAPDYFALRDLYWETGDSRFHELNDILQYLGFFAFRAPVPAYKHNAAMFLKLRNWIQSDLTHPHSPTRPEHDTEVLSKILDQLQKF